MIGDYNIDAVGVDLDLTRRRPPTRFAGFGDNVPMWDNRASFIFGDLVRYGERYWKATRDVYPPLFPSFMSGDVPGDSDAWRPVGASAVREQLRGDFVPDSPAALEREKEVNARARQMAGLKQVPVTVADVLLRRGAAAIVAAVGLAKGANLPGDANRQAVVGKMQWHAARLAETNQAITQMRTLGAKAGAGDPDRQFYAYGDDLKKWVLQAWAEWDAAADGVEAVGAAWTTMWDEIADALAKLPAEVLAAVGDAAKAVGNAATNTLKTVAIGAGIAVGCVAGIALFTRSMSRR